MLLRTGLVLACAAVLCAAPALGADANAPAADAATVAALTAKYHRDCQLMSDPTDANLDAVFAEMAPEYVAYEPNGTMTKRAEIVPTLKQRLKSIHVTTCDGSFESITSPNPTTAVAVVNTHVAGDLQFGGAMHALEYSSTSVDTLRLIKGAWMLTQARASHVVIKIDGAIIQEEGS